MKEEEEYYYYRHLASLLMEKPKESLSPALDLFVLVPMRVHYYAWRLLLRLAFGREQRNRSQFLLRIRPRSMLVPSYEMAKIVHNMRTMDKKKKKGKPSSAQKSPLVKVTVPELGYGYYCRLVDFAPGREDDIIQRFNPLPGQVVIDVGAHVGRYTLLSSKLVGPGGKVIAVEAAPANFYLLQRNLRLNNSDNVIALNCAAFSRDIDKMQLFLPGKEQGNTIYNTVMEQRATTTQESVTVSALTLDTVLKKAGVSSHEVNWIKIDVEGAEYEVLKGAQEILANSNDLSLLVEVHNLAHGSYYRQIMEMLGKHDFEVTYEIVHESGERHMILRKKPQLFSKK